MTRGKKKKKWDLLDHFLSFCSFSTQTNPFTHQWPAGQQVGPKSLQNKAQGGHNEACRKHQTNKSAPKRETSL